MTESASDTASGAEATPRVCPCGAELPPRAAHRPRVYCSPACRRRADRSRRQLRRRLEWREEWLDHRGGEVYTDAEIDHEIGELDADIAELRAALGGALDGELTALRQEHIGSARRASSGKGTHDQEADRPAGLV